MTPSQTRPPNDTHATLLWHRQELPNGISVKAIPNPERNLNPCNVYWGSHGCARPKGHDGDHWCDCCDCENHPDPDSGCVAGPPYYDAHTKFYGDDA